MININKARIEFKKFLDKYKNQDTAGFELKVVHTYHVVDNARTIATMLHLSDEDRELAELIALLHDIGRFEEITYFKRFDSAKFDHAAWGVKMLFEDGMIRNFIEDDSYDEIIKIAIDNHSRLKIKHGMDDITLLNAKIIRDADKLDNFRVKKEENIEAIFPGIVKTLEEFKDSLLSDVVYEKVKEERCVNIRDRKTPLDYWVCVLAFTFDLNFKESLEIVYKNDYINCLIDRFSFNDKDTQDRMECVRKILNDYVMKRINESSDNNE